MLLSMIFGFVHLLLKGFGFLDRLCRRLEEKGGLCRWIVGLWFFGLSGRLRLCLCLLILVRLVVRYFGIFAICFHVPTSLFSLSLIDSRLDDMDLSIFEALSVRPSKSLIWSSTTSWK